MNQLRHKDLNLSLDERRALNGKLESLRNCESCGLAVPVKDIHKPVYLSCVNYECRQPKSTINGMKTTRIGPFKHQGVSNG